MLTGDSAPGGSCTRAPASWGSRRTACTHRDSRSSGLSARTPRGSQRTARIPRRLPLPEAPGTPTSLPAAPTRSPHRPVHRPHSPALPGLPPAPPGPPLRGSPRRPATGSGAGTAAALTSLPAPLLSPPLHAAARAGPARCWWGRRRARPGPPAGPPSPPPGPPGAPRCCCRPAVPLPRLSRHGRGAGEIPPPPAVHSPAARCRCHPSTGLASPPTTPKSGLCSSALWGCRGQDASSAPL